MKRSFPHLHRRTLVACPFGIDQHQLRRLEDSLRGGIGIESNLHKTLYLKLHGDIAPFMGSDDLIEITGLQVGGHTEVHALVSLKTGEIQLVDPSVGLLEYLGFDTSPTPHSG